MTDEEAGKIIDDAFAEWLAKNPPDNSAHEHYECTKATLMADLKHMVLVARWKASLGRLLRIVTRR